jgi:hypothetical protein
LGHHSSQPFEYGLDALLDGLEVRRSTPTRPTPSPHD